MKASELRIRNFVYHNHSIGMKLPVQITEGKDIDLADEFEPIPLTEEWLLKFGFERKGNQFYNLLKYSEVEILIRDNFWTCDGIVFSLHCLEYVHQLQNLYFALTGEELTIQS
jgi:hypothetical protein